MELVRHADGQWVERYSHGFCPSCRADWTPGRGGMHLGWMPCECPPGHRGHRRLACRACDTVVLEPPHHAYGPSAEYP